MTVSNDQCQENVKSMTDKIQKLDNKMSDKLTKIEVTIAGLPEKMSEKFDVRYANKKTEKAVDRLIWIVVTAVILAGLSFVINK